jgi:short-subunit dehydrogenase
VQPGSASSRLGCARRIGSRSLKVFGYIDLTRQVYAHMKERGHGVIINDIGAAEERFDARG